MEGFYPPPNELPSQEHLSQHSEDQDLANLPPHDISIPMHNPNTAPHVHLQLQQPQSVLYGQLLSSQAAMSGEDMDHIQRRRSVPQVYGQPMTSLPPHHRRISSIGANDMMTFGDGNNNFVDYHFSQSMSPPFATINSSLDMQGQIESYMADPANFTTISPDLMGTMMSSQFANMDMGQMTADSAAIHMFPVTDGPGQNSIPETMVSHFDPSHLAGVANDFSMMSSEDVRLGAAANHNIAEDGRTSEDDQDEEMTSVTPQAFAPVEQSLAQPPHALNLNLEEGTDNFAPNVSSSLPSLGHMSTSASAVPSHNAPSSSTRITQTVSPDNAVPVPAPVPPPAPSSTPREQPKEKAIYSKSGFDMLKALWLVATRKNPKINLGAVDMSCAFVVCDVTMNDCPIIYVSDNFQNLTGYSRHEIVGQNCRFLQAPDGKVEAGSKREFVDDGAVFNLKSMIHERREVQQSLINYRKGGKPFLNLLTMIPIPWDTDEIRYFIGFQIDLVECPDAISGQEMGSVKVNYKHTDIGQYIWTPPPSSQWEPENGQTLGVDDVSTLLQQFNPSGLVSDWHKQSWDKMLLENSDDVVHVLSLKGLFLYLSPACKRVLEYDSADLVGNSLSSVCHPSDIVPVTRELKDTTVGNQANIVFRIRRKQSGYTWFESHGSLFVEQGKGRKCIILVGRKRPVFALSRRSLEANGGIGDSELWTKLSTSGMFLSVSSNVRSLLDLQPESLIGTSIQDLMRKESRAEFGRAIEKARKGKIATCKHEVQNRRGQGLQAQTILYPGDTTEGQKPSFLLAQTKLLKASSRNIAPAAVLGNNETGVTSSTRTDMNRPSIASQAVQVSLSAGGANFVMGTQDAALASEDNIFDELRTTKCSSWQFELRQMEKVNRILAEELGSLLSNKKKRKRRKGVGNVARDCANCHTRNTPEWRRGPSGQRDLCNSCGLRWAKQTGRVSPRNSTRGGHNGNGDNQSKKSASPVHSSPLQRTVTPNLVGPASNDTDTSTGPVQLASKATGSSTGGGGGGGAAAMSATGQHAPSTMPSPIPLPLGTGTIGSGMASIREERDAINTHPSLDYSATFL